MKNKILGFLTASLIAAAIARAGSTNYFVALPRAGDGSNSVIWAAPVLTNNPGTNVGDWTNVVDGPINFLKIRLANVDCFYGYNITNASAANGTPVVQANSVDNINLMSPLANITNICARENGSTGNGTAEVWMSWQPPNKNAGFPR